MERAEADRLGSLAQRLAVLRAELDALLVEGDSSAFGELDRHVREVEALFVQLRELLRGGPASP